VKLAAYPFTEYGMLEGEVTRIQADSDSDTQIKDQSQSKDKQQSPLSMYKAIISLSNQVFESQGKKLKLVPGMQVVAEINQGNRTVMKYLLSPVRKTLDESGHER
jgi:hemolysin D